MRDGALVDRLLQVIEADIVPLTEAGVARGDKVFGAAILQKADGTLVVAASNGETENPLWHGEVAAINAFWQLPTEARPAPRDCLFLATHEPCSLCLSAITWSGFDNFHYLFGYDATADRFNIPHDLKILQEVFKLEAGDYAKANHYWESHGLATLIAALPDADRSALTARVTALTETYDRLSATYQAGKGGAKIPLD
ncbi:MAG: nucleoside deaminase [Pseudomonadota bacterium]